MSEATKEERTVALAMEILAQAREWEEEAKSFPSGPFTEEDHERWRNRSEGQHDRRIAAFGSGIDLEMLFRVLRKQWLRCDESERHQIELSVNTLPARVYMNFEAGEVEVVCDRCGFWRPIESCAMCKIRDQQISRHESEPAALTAAIDRLIDAQYTAWMLLKRQTYGEFPAITYRGNFHWSILTGTKGQLFLQTDCGDGGGLSERALESGDLPSARPIDRSLEAGRYTLIQLDDGNFVWEVLDNRKRVDGIKLPDGWEASA